MENLFVGLLGVLLGHYMTIRLATKKANLQERAFYFELEILLEKYKVDLVHKYDDFINPVKDEYIIGAPVIDMSLINALMVELAGSEKVLNQEIRKLIIHTSKFSEDLLITAKERESYNKGNSQNTEEFLRLTKKMLIEEVQLVFCLYKLIRDKNQFIFGEYKLLEMAKVACNVADIGFDKQIWQKIMPRSTDGLEA
ncbi:hypothetical protein [Vibrio vulnificus]|uniref:hypothetical protein n=1 Tax=Vibrio vulnificus TaxID=672 RepID=UPI003EDB67D2